MEETDIERVVFLQLGQEDGVGVRVGIVVVFAVAGQSAKEDTLVFAVPMVDGEHDKTLVDTPGVGEGGDKWTVDHVPHLAVVLLLLVENAVEGGTAFADGEAAKLGEDIRLFNTTDGADVLDLGQHLLGHVFIVVGGGKGGFAGETASDVEWIEFGTHPFEVAIDVDAFRQFVPIVSRVADTGVDEEVEHFEDKLLVWLDLLLIEADNVAVAHAETGGVKIELGFLLGGDADT